MGSEFWKAASGCAISSSKIPCVLIFRQNGQLWIFRPKFAQKRILGSEFWKTKSECRISSSKISYGLIFRQSGQLLLFRTKSAQKRILGSVFRNSNSGFGISASTMPLVPNFRQNGQLWIFGLNLGKLPNYVRYFGYYNIEAVAESWVEVDGAGWRWVHGLVIPGYNLIRAGDQNNIEGGEVCIYHWDALPVKVINANILNECLMFGIRLICLVNTSPVE